VIIFGKLFEELRTKRRQVSAFPLLSFKKSRLQRLGIPLCWQVLSQAIDISHALFSMATTDAGKTL
jgi:hypothetical protein